MKRLLGLVVAGVLSLSVGAGASVGAAEPVEQQTVTSAGISITPAIQDRVLGKTEKSAVFTTQLANQTDRSITFSLSSNDFKALNQTGGLAFLGSNIKEVTDGHGLSSILQLDTKLVTVPAKSSRTITARVNNLERLAPGGHYTAILAQALPDGNAARGNRVTLNQVVSSLIFLETAGQGTKTLTLLPPKVSSLSLSLPKELNLAFKATGNTQTIPRGVATVNHGGRELQRGVINQDSALLLPGSTRLLQTPLSGDRHPWLPGIYKLEVQYRYEGSLGVTTYSKRFLYINVVALIVIVLALVVLVGALWRLRRHWRVVPAKVRVIRRKKVTKKAAADALIGPAEPVEAPAKKPSKQIEIDEQQ